MGRPTIVDDQPPVVRAALKLADFAIELRNRGRAVEEAEQVLLETPEGQTRSATMVTRLIRSHDDMLKEFDKLADAYAIARLQSMRAAIKAVPAIDGSAEAPKGE